MLLLTILREGPARGPEAVAAENDLEISHESDAVPFPFPAAPAVAEPELGQAADQRAE